MGVIYSTSAIDVWWFLIQVYETSCSTAALRQVLQQHYQSITCSNLGISWSPERTGTNCSVLSTPSIDVCILEYHNRSCSLNAVILVNNIWILWSKGHWCKYNSLKRLTNAQRSPGWKVRSKDLKKKRTIKITILSSLARNVKV